MVSFSWLTKHLCRDLPVGRPNSLALDFSMKKLYQIITLFLACEAALAMGPEAGNFDDFSSRWLAIEIGMPLSEAKAVIDRRYTSTGVTNKDGSGYRKYWRGPKTFEATEEFVNRTIIPYGDVYYIRLNAEGVIVEKSHSFVSEKEFQKQVHMFRGSGK